MSRIVRIVVLVVLGLLVWTGSALASGAVRERQTGARFTALPGLGDVFAVVGERYFVYRRYELWRPIIVVDTKTGALRTVATPAGCLQFQIMHGTEDRMDLLCDGQVAVMDVATWTILPGVTELTGVGTPIVGRYRFCSPFGNHQRRTALQQLDGRLVYSGARHHLFTGRCGSTRSVRDASGRSAVGDKSVFTGWTTWVYPKTRARTACHVGSYDLATGVRTVWRALPFGPSRCVQRTFHTKYAVLVGHMARYTTGPNFLSSYRFAMARRP